MGIQSSAIPDMVFVQRAIFKMGDVQGNGDADERPVHYVKLTDYSIAKTEVTVFQWRTYCSSTNRAMPAAPNGDGSIIIPLSIYHGMMQQITVRG